MILCTSSPISKTTDRAWQQTQLENKNRTNMQNYLIEYWKSFAGDSLDPLTVCVQHLKDVKETNAMFKCGKQKGYYRWLVEHKKSGNRFKQHYRYP